jgi:DNA repair protein RecO (recombination protein O)
VPTYRASGVVLRTYKLGDADRIVTILTRDCGIVRAVAKGVRRTSSRFGARLEPFMYVDLQLYEGRSLDVITQVEVREAFSKELATDYAGYTAGTAMLETAEKLAADTNEPAIQQLNLLTSALRALTAKQRPPGVLLDSYCLRALAIAGYAPSFVDCVRCGAPGPHRHLHLASGGLLCDRCKVPGSSAPALGTVELLGALLAGDWDVVDDSDERSMREASGIVAAYVAWHLERGLRSMAHVDRSVPEAAPFSPVAPR